MPRRTLAFRLAAAAAGAALTLTLTSCAQGAPALTGGDNASSASSASSASDVHDGADTRFAQAMIVHHEGAIVMAGLAAQEATTPEVRALAEGISQAQGPEIELMTGWLQAWGEDVEASMPGMDHDGMDMGGMTMDGLTQEEAMADLDGLTGPDVDRRFLELMIAHHEGAITMAEQELAEGTDADALQLASTIIDDQSTEITTMQDLLAGL
ncbi:DUF305 domain-containing protein [Cellulomonas soli]|uniref:Lipoprotein n=1 Tax=Cellulomonas soli TaxID=931535 RepID=A0A512PHG9_9CELL|nr:DUF305 domain-containing protein [Cellulomonas soli]NYI60770.1 uncharacterized protein (DUF305 family) [Cellulomonas soli]GEP70646.1 lipoprotein [Cellulomonas soli]